MDKFAMTSMTLCLGGCVEPAFYLVLRGGYCRLTVTTCRFAVDEFRADNSTQCYRVVATARTREQAIGERYPI
jgi:hypothetical protein